MRTFYPFLLACATLLHAGPGQAQQVPITPADSVATTPAAAEPALPASTVPDVIVRASGAELPVRVVSVSPELVRYLPLPTAAQPTPTDTLALPVAEVLLVRYADGTRQTLRRPAAPAAPEPTALVGLSAEQRYEQGRRDSRQYYKPAKGVFWGSFAGAVVTTSYLGVGGLAVGAATSLTPPPRHSLDAPVRALLDDPAYYDGYRKQAQSRKLGKAAAGYGVGLGTGFVVSVAILAIIFSSWR